MKKFTVSALCCVAVCALGLAGCNKNSDSTMAGDKATCSERASGCCKEGAAKTGCCKEKAAAGQQN